ncbi:MAG TPA: hypothetical protein VM869_16245 [Enhygromyxa sp.]|nr:hypothetical protein [Enhygromyxa sp.]
MATQAISSRVSTVVLALSLASVGACKDKGDHAGYEGTAKHTPSKSDDGGDESHGSDEGDEEQQPSRDQEPDDPRATALTIAKSPAPSPIAGKGAKSLGFSLDKITHLFSLAATAKIPDWGAPGQGEPKLARDDDLDTAWQCELGDGKPCVLGLALPEKAKVEVLRIYGAAGPRYRDYTGHPRVASVRVHTEAGYVDASLADGANHAYVRFDAPIETQWLAIEVLGTHPGKDDALVHLAEIEVYGTDGAPRQPIELDPDFAWASWETTAWSASGGDHTIRQVFLNFSRPSLTPEDPPSSRRLLRATAVFGQASDDYLLFERLHGTDCSEARGSYVLFDRRNRMFYPLGDLGGAGANVYRHAAGRGFAVGWMGEGVFTIKGIVEEAGVLEWRRPPSVPPSSGEALLREWGFETEPLARAHAIDEATAGCHRAAAGELDPLLTTAKFMQVGAEDPGDWLVCSVGEDTLFASAPCGKPARAYQLSDGKLVGKHEGKHDDARALRVHRVGDRVLVELSAAGGDTSTLLWAEPGRLLALGEQAGLFVRPPAACSECDDAWPNPAAVPSIVEGGETSGDETGELADEGELVDEADGEAETDALPPPTTD